MIFEKLLKLEEELNPIRIGSHGAGWMGSGFVTQVNLIKGMVVSCLADENPEKAYNAYISSGGEKLDTFGGYTFYGIIEKYETAKSLGALPVGIAPGAKLKTDIKEGSIITWDDVILDETSTIVKLRRMQDKNDDNHHILS